MAPGLKRKIYPLTVDNNAMCSWIDVRQAEAQDIGTPEDTLRRGEGDMDLRWLAWATQIEDLYSELWTRVCWIGDCQGESLRSMQRSCEVVELLLKELAQGLRCHDSIEPVIFPLEFNVRCVCPMHCDLLIHQPRMERWNVVVDASMLL
jgi:hypothetical protein